MKKKIFRERNNFETMIEETIKEVLNEDTIKGIVEDAIQETIEEIKPKKRGRKSVKSSK